MFQLSDHLGYYLILLRLSDHLSDSVTPQILNSVLMDHKIHEKLMIFAFLC